MPKFLAVGHHGPIDPDLGAQLAEQAMEWIPARLADGLLDCLYSMEGGGRLIIANAESKEELETILRAGPDAPDRSWQITELHDGLEVVANYVRQVRAGAVT